MKNDMVSWWRRCGAVLCALTILAGCAAVGSGSDESDARLSQGAEVAASSASPQHPPRGLVDSGDPDAPGPAWRSSGEAVGAWVELHWSSPRTLRRVELVREATSAPGPRAGFLAFEDGSFLQVKLSPQGRSTVIPFAPREVDRVRFTVSEVDPGARDVGFSELLVGASPRGDDVVGGDQPSQPEGTLRGPMVLSAGSSVDLQWEGARELTAVQIVGGLGGARVASARLTFSDGAELALGSVTDTPATPTTVGFMPRVARSARLTVDRVENGERAVVGRVALFGRGVVPPGPPGPRVEPSPTHVLTSASACTGAGGPAPRLTLACPAAGSVVGDRATVAVRAPVGTELLEATPWPAADPRAATGTSRVPFDPQGRALVEVNLTGLAPGPLTVALSAVVSGRPETVHLPLFLDAKGQPAARAPDLVHGRTLVFAEEFDRVPVITRDGLGADYAAAKPRDDGVEEFGEAVFTDPATGPHTLNVIAPGHLRIDVAPLPAGTDDPGGFGRRHVGGLLSSARAGGSGFSAQYGHFEARMATSAAPGLWPAFWTLPADNLADPEPQAPGRSYREIFDSEIDAVELYGHEPQKTCHSTHDYEQGRRGGFAHCDDRRYPTPRDGLAWRTYGVSITPTENVFTIDGQVVATAPQVPGGGSPMFFLVDLALGGGWPVDLGTLGERAQVYVDHVRVYV